MHFEIFVEDRSGKELLDRVVPTIIGDNTFRVNYYWGKGSIPMNPKPVTNIKSQMLLNDLPRTLGAYGKTFAGWGENYAATLVVVCDLDRDCLKELRNNLIELLSSCNPPPKTVFCIAVQEIEAWLLGDIDAVSAVYPKAKRKLSSYSDETQNGTWETLADAVYSGGSKALKDHPYSYIGIEKSKWAKEIAPRINIETNRSPSFCYFRDKLRALGAADP